MEISCFGSCWRRIVAPSEPASAASSASAAASWALLLLFLDAKKLLQHLLGFFGGKVAQLEFRRKCFQARTASLLLKQLSDLAQVDRRIHRFDTIGGRQRS